MITMGNLYWDHEYDAAGTAVLYTAADAGNTTAIATLRARDARAGLQVTYRLVKRQYDRGSESATFVDAVAAQVKAAVNQMEMRDAHAGEYARQHVVFAFRMGGMAGVLEAVTLYGKRAEKSAIVRPETIASLARKFCA
jgi:hypothetical protein